MCGVLRVIQLVQKDLSDLKLRIFNQHVGLSRLDIPECVFPAGKHVATMKNSKTRLNNNGAPESPVDVGDVFLFYFFFVENAPQTVVIASSWFCHVYLL